MYANPTAQQPSSETLLPAVLKLLLNNSNNINNSNNTGNPQNNNPSLIIPLSASQGNGNVPTEPAAFNAPPAAPSQPVESSTTLPESKPAAVAAAAESPTKRIPEKKRKQRAKKPKDMPSR